MDKPNHHNPLHKSDSGKLNFMDIDESFFLHKHSYPINECYGSDEKEMGKNNQLGDIKMYKEMYEQSIKNPEPFWGDLAKKNLRWNQLFTKVYVGKFKKGNVSWFVNGKINASDNCIDRWVEKHPLKTAIIWEQDIPNKCKKITYQKLLEETCRVANLLKFYGVKKQDVVTIYLPMLPELVYTMLACTRIGAIHNVVFAGFSANSLHERILDSKSKVLVTCDFGLRGGKLIKLKQIADDAMDMCNLIKICIVFKNKTKLNINTDCEKNSNNICSTTINNLSNNIVSNNNNIFDKTLHQSVLNTIQDNKKEKKRNNSINCENKSKYEFDTNLCILKEGRDINGSISMKKMRPYCPIEYVDSEDFLCILYTSGSTGKPKGVAHTTAGYLLYAYTTCKYIFNVNENDIFGCVADIGWVTGHTYVVYGPLLNGITTIMFGSIPSYPDCGRYWQLIETHKVTQFYAAPTALRGLMKHGDSFVEKHDLSSCKVLGSVGEPINPETWRWYYNIVGKKKCAIVDTYWQTETGGIVLAPIPKLFKMKPGCAGLPFFGIELEILESKTLKPLTGNNVYGLLCIKSPWPGMLRSIYGNHNRLINTYFSLCKDYYFTGDGAYRDEEGFYWISGRIDDTLNVSGHRLGAAEIEHALVQHKCIAESAVVSYKHKIKGEGILCFVVKKCGDFKNYSEENEVSKKVPRLTLNSSIISTHDVNTKYTDERLKEELKLFVRQVIGPIATPDIICIVPDLPKTRSGKIIRRILRCIANEIDSYSDLTTISNYEIIDTIKKIYKECKEKSATSV
ncbi:acetyl-CoA synthetase, putative [Hepatocystis sp. ex Piliocolobus tephrosceles]|nr:acetyl-CoA synthetase, putative [Hepatocystis sp. ex Piliocolobus tephrosceles]